ncbi:MAG: hypothetical protein WD053_04415 [Gracilimonas sp.]
MINIIYSCKLLILLLTIGFNLDDTLSNPSNDKDIVMVYIGTSNCSFCTSEENDQHLKTIFEGIARNKQFAYRKIGISIDENLVEGFNFLNDLNVRFDEIIVASRNTNLGYIKYVKDEFIGVEIVPQVLVLLSVYKSNNKTEIIEEKLLYRVVGIEKMKTFGTVATKINLNNLVN